MATTGLHTPAPAVMEPALSIGAANPLRIAELRLGRKLDPAEPGFRETMAEALELPFEKLFDPKFGSPVFIGIKSVHAPPVIEKEPPTKLAAPPAATAEHALGVGSPPEHAGAPLLGKLPVSVLHKIEVPLPVWWPPLPLTDLKYGMLGEFIVDVPSATAPWQGAPADCWLISAMASVAWCHSDAISERTLKAGSGVVGAGGADYEFTFYAAPDWSVGRTLSVKDDLPETPSGDFIYACSTVPGETWPANLEKAFIGMRGATGFLEPSSTNYDELIYGDPAWAVASLVGRPPWYHAANATDAWATINANCAGGRATTPMTAWTYGTGSATISYDGSGIVANHAYSILGTMTSGGNDYVVLRNPWSWHEGVLNTLPGSFQGLTLPGGGVFALRMDTFSQYYVTFGGA
jgi:calpain family cysteine protease